jgi:hypothetical protein
MLMFPKTQVAKFAHTNKALRWGQAFHRFMKLEKISNPQDKEFCDRLYQAADEKAKAMVQSRTDHSQ